ncbi:SitA6 family polymorphic toxin lipoprotein [Myxococcus qinghaiensis]|uniref:SitA6 family polymorphic toxin lipoprotein n=1 Tax=Myxococcus qinghaiensis TaxID=2906758 RepID=UPI0020A805F3|nr:TIGR02269 family lipoprotein [Myxococcus qinghaiensis]MCP3164997.1 TIGR02269 family lipoprotein [Myxococcus qinghaiensis]
MRASAWALCVCVLLLACASTAPGVEDVGGLLTEASQDASAEACAEESESEAGCIAPACAGDTCGLFRCEDLASPPVALRGSLPARPGTAPQRLYGAAQPLPGRGPALVIEWHRKEELPSQTRLRKAYSEWASRPKEKHHIFPRAFERYFDARGINIHEYALAIDVAHHRKIHEGPGGGPWNQEWRAYIERRQGSRPPRRDELFAQASGMIVRYGLVGMPMSYWQQLSVILSTPAEVR